MTEPYPLGTFPPQTAEALWIEHDTEGKPPDYWKLPDETTAAFSAFKSYCEMPPAKRDLKALAKATDRTHGTLKNWSSKYDWAIRAESYDADVTRVRAEQALRNSREKGKEFVRVSEQIGRPLAYACKEVADQISEFVNSGRLQKQLETIEDLTALSLALKRLHDIGLLTWARALQIDEVLDLYGDLPPPDES